MSETAAHKKPRPRLRRGGIRETGPDRSVREPGQELVRYYVWDGVVRTIHWVIVVALALLVVTGIYIGNPFAESHGDPSASSVMGTMKNIHFASAIAFTLAVFSRIVWMFRGGFYADWKKFIPVEKRRRAGFVRTLAFYLFIKPKPPHYVGHNPLAGFTYTLVYLVFFVMILTGFALYSLEAHYASHMQLFSFLLPLFGGAQVARWIHHVGMWLLLGFFVHHLYSAIMMSIVERTGTLDSIFTGHKWVRRRELGMD